MRGVRKRLMAGLLALVSFMMLAGCARTSDRGSPKSREAHHAVVEGAELLDKGKEKMALKAFEKAARLAPSDREVHTAVGILLLSERMYREAIPYLERAVTLTPDKADVMSKVRQSELYTAVGDAYGGLREFVRAEEAYQQAIALNPDNARAYNNWGYTYADLGIELDEALKLTQRAVELEPNNGAYVDSLGWAHFRKGNYRQAAELLKKAVRLLPSDPEPREHLAKAYEAIGDKRSAEIEYRKARLLSKRKSA